MFFQINCGIPLELGRLPSKENGANLTVAAAQQQELSPPTPFADTKGTNCCFSEQAGQLLGAEVEEIGGDAPGMLFPSKSPSKFPSNVPIFPSKRIPELPNPTHHFSPAGPIYEPGETQENKLGQSS